MKYDAIKKKGEQWVRIRPALQIYSESAVLQQDAVEDQWWLSDITEDGVKLQNRSTQHFRHLGLDHIHHYMDDPDPSTGGTTGILVLNVQLLMFEDKLLAEPIRRPGEALEKFVPARTRETLFSAAVRAAERAALERRQKEFARSDGVEAVKTALADLQDEFRRLEQELAARGTKVPITIKPHGHDFLLGACGWWVSIVWQWSGAGLEDSLLTMRKWDGHPRWPGWIAWDEGHQVTVDQYSFGLVSLSEARWIARASSERSYSSAELAAKLLTELVERPRE